MEMLYAVKYPILLLRSHTLTSLKQAHERIFHNGVKETLAETRSKYWIPSGQSFTRNIINNLQEILRTPFQGSTTPTAARMYSEGGSSLQLCWSEFCRPFDGAYISVFSIQQSLDGTIHLLHHQSRSCGCCSRSIHSCIYQMP